MSAVAPRVVRDGRRQLVFNGSVLGAVTAARPDAPRWSEMAIYQATDGTYLISKIGRSTVAHRPECSRVNRFMVALHAAPPEEASVWRVACPECRPTVGNHDVMDPATMLETTRYRVLTAQDAQTALHLLVEGRPRNVLPQLIRELLAQASLVDPNFASQAEAFSPPKAEGV